MVLEKTFHFGASLVGLEASRRRRIGDGNVRDTDDLDEIENRLDHGKSVEFEGNIVELDRPRADAIEMDFMPRDNGGVSRSKFAVLPATSLDLRADLTIVNNGANNVA